MVVCGVIVPFDSGHYGERMGSGPKRLWESSIQPMLVRLGHTVEVQTLAASDAFPVEIKSAFAAKRWVAETVRSCRKSGRFPLVLSGNCNAAVGSVSGCGCRDTGVIWFDAHGEATTPETTTSGFLDGMGISVLTGQCWRNLARSIPGFEPVPGARIVLAGARDLEDEESRLLDRVGVRRVLQPEDLAEAVAPIATETDGVYLHFDLDVLDPREAVANQWAPPGGFSVEGLVNAVKAVRHGCKVKAAGFGSYDPDVDRDGRAARAARLCIEALLG